MTKESSIRIGSMKQQIGQAQNGVPISAELGLSAKDTSQERKALLRDGLAKARELTRFLADNNIGGMWIYGQTEDGTKEMRLQYSVNLRKD